jgi:formylglycine-generating enzyme required for sulfatase activity
VREAGKKRSANSNYNSKDIRETTITLGRIAEREVAAAILAIDQETLVYSVYPLFRADALTGEDVERIRREERAKEEAKAVITTYIDPGATDDIKGIDMVLVEGGSMEIQGKLVTLDSFYMNKYELSMYMVTEAHNWAYDQGYFDFDVTRRDHSNNDTKIPSSMLIREAIAICNYLSLMEGFTPVYYYANRTDPILQDDAFSKAFYINWDADGYRLPTEAEWEYAARGGKQSCGYTYAGSDVIDEVAWYDYRAQGNEPQIGQKKPNELGFYDMSGLSSEWCIDRWQYPALMEPSHNPGRIYEYPETDLFTDFCLKKDNNMNNGIGVPEFLSFFTPQARDKTNFAFDQPYRSQYNMFNALRLVRNIQNQGITNKR